MTYAEQFIANTIGEADGQDFDWTDSPELESFEHTAADQIERYEAPDGSAIVVTCTGWDFGIHRSWVEAPEVVSAVEASDDWTCYPEFVWPECVHGLDSAYRLPKGSNAYILELLEMHETALDNWGNALARWAAERTDFNSKAYWLACNSRTEIARRTREAREARLSAGKHSV